MYTCLVPLLAQLALFAIIYAAVAPATGRASQCYFRGYVYQRESLVHHFRYIPPKFQFVKMGPSVSVLCPPVVKRSPLSPLPGRLYFHVMHPLGLSFVEHRLNRACTSYNLPSRQTGVRNRLA